MSVLFESGYSLPSGDQPLTHARIAHAGNWYSGTATASSTATDYFAAAPSNSLTYEKWKPSSLSATWELDFGSAQDVDYCCIGAHNMGDNGNSLTVQEWDGSSWNDVIASTAIADNSAIMCIFSETSSSKMRISISSGTAPEIGVIRFGKALQMTQAIFGGHAPVTFSRNTETRSQVSMSGQFLGRTIQRKWLETEYSWTHLKTAFIRANWLSLQRSVETDPIFIAWRPGDNTDCAYGWINQPPVPSNMGVKDFMQVSFNLMALSND